MDERMMVCWGRIDSGTGLDSWNARGRGKKRRKERERERLLAVRGVWPGPVMPGSSTGISMDITSFLANVHVLKCYGSFALNACIESLAMLDS